MRPGGNLLSGRARTRVVALVSCVLLAAVAVGVVRASTSGSGAGSAPRAGRSEVRGGAGLCPQQFGSFSAGHWPPGCWRPYGPSSPFNTPIPPHPRLSGESSAIIRYMRTHRWTLQTDRSGRFTLDAGGSRPVYWATSSDPLVKVSCRGGYPCQRGIELRIPAGAKPEDQSDGHMTVVEQAEGREWDFWRASMPRRGRMTVSAGGSVPIGPNSGTGLGGVAEAADLGLLGGLMRAPELAAGRVEHALVLDVPCVQYSDVWPSPSWASGDTICPRHGAGPRYASLLQLDMSAPEIAATGAPAWQQALMSAMARYGIYVVDTSGLGEREMSLLTEDDQSFKSFHVPGEMSSFVRAISGGAEQVGGAPIDVARLRVIAPCVPRGTC